ncbi:methionyl-tRNA formyltransferase [uncultured Tyzzerella sp.]|uniref:methionyl-tRNA formyltransferase n=1 Tax=uncultured Tyzzerella sp. TaxID=2321398 RepID=UPI002943D3CF|nr:methionyl-tRNA formyltransferase [uncultured Tyzzerella sp.]
MNIVFMGTPDFAVESLKKLIENHNVIAVISQPDKPKGRGKKLFNTPVKQFAIDNGIEKIYQPEKARDESFVKELKSLNADLFVVVAYGQILSEEVLNIPKYGCINVHGSLLPKYRGAAPIQWAIINGEEKTGVTIQYMEKGVDTGDMILKEEIVIEKTETYKTLYDKMSVVGAEALIKAIYLIETGNAKPEKQDHDEATFAPMINKEMGHIDWNNNSKDIINLIRGINPMPMAYTVYKDEVFKISEAEEVTGYSGNIGEIVDVQKDGFIVKTKDSAVIIKEMQAKGGKRMKSSDYLRGHSIEKQVILC